MKKWFNIVVLSILVAPWGCTTVDYDPAPSRKVTFEVGSFAPQTRAIESVGGEVTSFYSRAWMHGAGVEAPVNFFPEAGESIIWDGSLWAPAIDYFWPKASGSHINFMFWSGSTVPVVGYTESAGVRTATLKWQDYEVQADDNLMWADMAWHYKSGSQMAEFQKDGTYTGVPVLFHHALSRIRLQAKAETLSNPTDGTSWTVKVDGYSISGVYTTGTLSLTNTENTGDTAEYTEWTIVNDWGGRSGKTSFSDSGLNETLGTADYVTLMDYRSVLPQPVGDIKLTLSCTIRTIYAGGKTVEEQAAPTVSLSSFAGAPESWEKNTMVTYRVSVNPDTSLIEIIPDVKDWDSTSMDRRIE